MCKQLVTKKPTAFACGDIFSSCLCYSCHPKLSLIILILNGKSTTTTTIIIFRPRGVDRKKPLGVWEISGVYTDIGRICRPAHFLALHQERIHFGGFIQETLLYRPMIRGNHIHDK